jgi:hypothetical protein
MESSTSTKARQALSAGQAIHLTKSVDQVFFWRRRQVTIHEAKTHLSRLIEEALQGEEIVIAKGRNLVHRGAVGGDSRTGDGAGMLTQVPYRFFTREASRLGFSLPAKGPESFLFDAADEQGRGGRSGDIGVEAAARRTLRTRAL